MCPYLTTDVHRRDLTKFSISLQVFKIEKSCVIILAGGVPVVALIAGLLFVPESPRWLVSLLAML